MNYFETQIEVRTSKTRKEPRKVWLAQDGIFAINYSIPNQPDLGFAVTHAPTGYTLSQFHASRREAELYVAIWNALPINWNRTTARPLQQQITKLPVELRRWIHAVRPPNTEKKG